jgi:hypothetical protein
MRHLIRQGPHLQQVREQTTGMTVLVTSARSIQAKGTKTKAGRQCVQGTARKPVRLEQSKLGPRTGEASAWSRFCRASQTMVRSYEIGSYGRTLSRRVV